MRTLCAGLAVFAAFVVSSDSVANPSRPKFTVEPRGAQVRLDVNAMRGLPPERWKSEADILSEKWARENFPTGPLLPKAVNDTAKKILSKLVVQMLSFARGVSSDSRSFSSTFHAELLHAISDKAPGFAWVLSAERTSFELSNMAGVRAGGGAGVQIPVLGAKKLFLKDDQGQLVVRLMPIAGNFESVSIGENPENRTPSPETGVVVRPSAEVEASYQVPGLRPGARFLIQPRLAEPNQMRMLAEVFVDIDVQVGLPRIGKISIVPRCIMDFSNERYGEGSSDSRAFNLGYRLLNRMSLCSITAELTTGI